MNEFTNLVAVVTGGAGGIGAATADLLVKRGTSVAVLDLDVRSVPDDRLGVRCDVTDGEQVRAAVAAVVDQFAGIDILINNAGVGAIGDVSANDDAEWRRVLDVNVVAIARVTRAALPHLRASSYASIVNTCSVVASTGVPNRVLYAASKGAVAAMTLSMAADHVNEAIRVNAVNPGTTDTPWVGRLLDAADNPDAAAQALRDRQPMGRLVSAEEVAHSIAYLASPLSASTTGSILAVDRGMAGLRLR